MTSIPRRRLVLWLGAFLAAALCVMGLLALWPPACVSTTPGRDVRLAGALAMEETIQTLLSAHLSSQPVQVVISAEELDGYAAALLDDSLWHQLRIQDQEQRQRLRLTGLSDLHIQMKEDELWVTGTLAGTRPRVIVSLRLRPEVSDPDRDPCVLRFRLTGLRVGRLPLPAWLGTMLSDKLHRLEFVQSGSWRVKRIGLAGGRLYVLAGPVSRP